jgi:KEOPS complex subunit Cgi121
MQVVAGRARIDDVRAFVETLGEIGEDHGYVVQPLDARYVVDRAHLERAVELAERARERGEAIADDPAVEVLLYAAGRRQIDRALEMGVGDGETPAAILVDAGGDDGDDGDDGEEPGAAESAAADAVREFLDEGETLGDYDEDRLREFYGVGDRELSATTAGLEALALERVALLVVER